MSIIITHGLTKNYGKINAVNNLNLSVERGEILGLVGENGAGKTTIVRMLTTMISPTYGEVIFNFSDVTASLNDKTIIRNKIGVLPQNAGIYEEFNAYENLDFIGNLRGIPKVERKTQIDELLDIVNLTERAHDRSETYSGGMKRKLMVARALLGNPEVIFLDEPLAMLDVLVARNIRKLIKNFAKNHRKTVILATHNMFQAESLCDRIAIINKGNLVELDSPINIKQRFGNLTETFEDVVARILEWEPQEA